jgi:hypothetical protein
VSIVTLLLEAVTITHGVEGFRVQTRVQRVQGFRGSGGFRGSTLELLNLEPVGPCTI